VRGYSFTEAPQLKPIESQCIGLGELPHFLFCNLGTDTDLIVVEAAQLKPIEKPMYRSGSTVTILILHFWNRYRFVRPLRPHK